MGQSSALHHPIICHPISPTHRKDLTVAPQISSPMDGSIQRTDQDPEDGVFEGCDYISNVPDEILSSIFNCLSTSDRKSCAFVCKRWLVVEGQSRNRLVLNARRELLTIIPTLFSRFDSVTKLVLRCDRRSISIDDESLIQISLRCQNLTRLKLRGCRELTDVGLAAFAKNAKGLKKFSSGTCLFGVKGMNAVLENCQYLEELSIKRHHGVLEPVSPDFIASHSLKTICFREIYNGHCFGPLIIGAKNLKRIKILRCMGDWDRIFQTISTRKDNPLMEIILERIQLSDTGLDAISRFTSLETLHLVKTPECTDKGLISVSENCKQLRKLHIDGWKMNRIGNQDGLINIAHHCSNLQELVLISVNPSAESIEALATRCKKLERLALCGIETIGDAEISCIADKCVELKKICIKGCPITDKGLEAFAWGCPNLVKIKVKKCRGVIGEVIGKLKARRGMNLVVSMDVMEIIETGTMVDEEGDESEASASSSNGGSMFNSRFGLLAFTFRRWSIGGGRSV